MDNKEGEEEGVVHVLGERVVESEKLKMIAI